MTKKTTDNTDFQKIFENIEKQFGKGSVMILDGDEAFEKIATIPSGSLALDKALGVGGYARGRIVEIYGPESSGKTTLTLHAIKEAQKQGLVCAFIDAEHALDVNYAKALGVDCKNVLISQPDSGEQALEITEELIKSGKIGLVIVDSVAALVPEAELAGDMGDSHVGLHARLMSQAMRKLSGIVAKSNTTLIFINQIREKVGVLFGSPETTTGGRALKFYATQRIEVRKGESLKQSDGTLYGNLVNIKVVKNKVASPFRSCSIELRYGTGFSRVSEVINLAVEKNLIQRAGSWFSLKEEKIGQGKAQVEQYLLKNPEIMAELELEIQKTE